MHLTDEKIVKKPRRFYPEDLDINNCEVLEREMQALLDTPLPTPEALIEWMERYSELGYIIGDRMAWLYIKMTCHADDEEKEKAFNTFYADIITPLKPYDFRVLKKFYDSPARKLLSEATYAHLNRIISNDIELFREENVPLQQQERELENKFGNISGKMTVQYRGEEKTLKQMAVYQKDPDRAVREETWRLTISRVAEDADQLDALFDEMRALRMQIARNAGFDNYRDYSHQSKGRFSYTPQDIFLFHDAVEKAVVPFVSELNAHRKQVLGINTLRPWDKGVDLDGKILRPFKDSNELIDKSLDILYRVKPSFAMQVAKMRNSGYLDLDNRKGKAPGGYNYGIEEEAASFIFMNSVGLHDDIVTFLHESGHASHNAAIGPRIPICFYRNTPSELAELASMSMELLTMDHWNIFYADPEDLKKAKREQLEGTLTFLPWCMTVDALQQWAYTNPKHTPKQRADFFASLMDRFAPDTDYTGLEKYKRMLWMRQLHIFETPFYYIEYGISQLGALAIYRNYRKEPQKAVEMYERFLQLGYTKPMNEVYEAAGIRFDFSEPYIRSLVDFVREELAAL